MRLRHGRFNNDSQRKGNEFIVVECQCSTAGYLSELRLLTCCDIFKGVREGCAVYRIRGLYDSTSKKIRCDPIVLMLIIKNDQNAKVENIKNLTPNEQRHLYHRHYG